MRFSVTTILTLATALLSAATPQDNNGNGNGQSQGNGSGNGNGNGNAKGLGNGKQKSAFISFISNIESIATNGPALSSFEATATGATGLRTNPAEAASVAATNPAVAASIEDAIFTYELFSAKPSKHGHKTRSGMSTEASATSTIESSAQPVSASATSSSMAAVAVVGPVNTGMSGMMGSAAAIGAVGAAAVLF